MEYKRKNNGVCSSYTQVKINDDGIIEDAFVAGGCDGNLKGVCNLITGMKAKEAIAKLNGIKCGQKKSSCPEQIALTLEEAMQLAQ